MKRSARRGVELSMLLLGVMVLELALNRLAVPALRPAVDDPGAFHRGLDQVALFVFHFASALAVAALASKLYQLATTRDLFPSAARYAIAATGAAFLVLAALCVVISPPIPLQLAMHAAYTLTLLAICAAQLTRPGDPFAELGIAVLCVPLVMLFYAPFMLAVVYGADLSMYPNVPDTELAPRLRELGQMSTVVAALLSPYLFAPRPIRLSVPKVAPLVIAAFVGLIAGLIVREHFEVGMELAARGLGFQLGPGAPRPLVALYLLALASITWTLVSCLIAETPARRRIGLGLGLVLLGGYSFSWPLQYVVSVIGVLVIGLAAGPVAAAERDLDAAREAFQAPQIGDEAWQGYVRALVDALPADAVSLDDDDGQRSTHLVGTRRGVQFQIHAVRQQGGLRHVDVQLGAQPDENVEPDWTLYARPEHVLSLGHHPEPPPTSAPPRRLGDHPFDRRFRIRDRGAHSDRLLDDGLRARAAALIDGWLALWPGRSLYYRVCPGRGAPLDHPVPVSELAFRGEAANAVDRLGSVLDLLTELAERAGLAGVRDRPPEPAAHDPTAAHAPAPHDPPTDHAPAPHDPTAAHAPTDHAPAAHDPTAAHAPTDHAPAAAAAPVTNGDGGERADGARDGVASGRAGSPPHEPGSHG